LYDGTVCVYDVKQLDGPNTKPIFLSTDPKHKHTDPVWQVYWSREEPTEDSGLNFFSVSSDGRVTNWILSKNTLVNEEVVALKLITDDDKVKEEDTVVGLAGGCCFDFNRTKEDLFVVGTEEGAIHYYSKAYNAQFLRGFSGHHMAVYSVKWNTFHPKVFLSCSADWTVKLWEVGCSKPVMTFDLNTSVGDIAWAPFSSTVFATITHTDGKVRVFDLAVNKHEPIGEHRLKKAKGNAKLTHISFNPTEPIVCVGDHTGVLTILKLSSNLRKMSAPTLEDIKVEDEIAKLEKVMIMPDDDGEEDIQTLLEAAKRVGNEEEIVEETKEEEKKAE
jgi:dynein intermediate chain 1